MAKPGFESYEVQGTPYEQKNDRNSLIAQIVRERVKDVPTVGILVSFEGNTMKVRYHCYETYLADRKKVDALYKEAEKHIRDFVKELKSEYRKRSKAALTATEIKERRDYSVQKVSLNDRYYFVSQQVYDLGD